MRWKCTQRCLSRRRQSNSLVLWHTTIATRDGMQTIHQLFGRIRGNIIVVLGSSSASPHI